jgi:acyl-CoA thioesterase
VCHRAKIAFDFAWCEFRQVFHTQPDGTLVASVAQEGSVRQRK